MQKLLRLISALVKILGIVTAFGYVPGLPAKWGVIAYMIAGGLKDFLLFCGDVLDDGQRNNSFKVEPKVLALTLFACLLTGCASYTAPDGSRLVLFGQKAAFEGLRVSPKTGLSVKTGETSADAELLKAIAEGAARGARPLP